MPLPVTARPADEVLAELDDLQRDDVRWREGRAFTLAYHAGDEVKALADEASRRFSSANALNPDAFPSLRRLQRDVVDIVGRWLDAPPEAAGFVTSGGTESLLMAVKAARTRGRRTGDIVTPNMVLPASAHAAFEKAAAYFGVESRRIAVRQDWRADVDAMAAAMDDDTVLLVGSAPQYPQGVIDPIADIAALADTADVNCHVDACMGGITLPYLRRMGRPVPPWDFEVTGVTSMSVDLHKFGYTTKGASVIVHRDHQRRADQTFVTDNWLGGRYGSPSVLGTRGGGPIAAAWAVLQHIGDEGYLRLAQAARRATEQLTAAVEARSDLALRARPDAMLVAFGAADDTRLDIFAVADELWRQGWYLDRQSPPPSLHCTVNAVHDGRIDDFVAALDGAVAEALLATRPGAAGAYSTVE